MIPGVKMARELCYVMGRNLPYTMNPLRRRVSHCPLGPLISQAMGCVVPRGCFSMSWVNLVQDDDYGYCCCDYCYGVGGDVVLLSWGVLMLLMLP